MKTLAIITTIVIELSVYGIVYYMGYKRGKEESSHIKTNIEFDIGKVAKNDK
jgi:hypothetical protein